MTDIDMAREDERIRALFQGAAGAIPDDGFTARVQARLSFRLRARWLAPAAAALTGLLLAWDPLVRLSGWFGHGMLDFARRGADPGWIAQHPGWPMVVLLVLALPVVVRWLER